MHGFERCVDIVDSLGINSNFQSDHAVLIEAKQMGVIYLIPLSLCLTAHFSKWNFEHSSLIISSIEGKAGTAMYS